MPHDHTFLVVAGVVFALAVCGVAAEVAALRLWVSRLSDRVDQLVDVVRDGRGDGRPVRADEYGVSADEFGVGNLFQEGDDDRRTN